MLNLNCVICAELFTAASEVHVTNCGHMFHTTCLIQWLQRSPTCPQCRNKCTERNIIRLYFNLANLDVSRLDVGSLQEQLDNMQLKLNTTEKELKIAKLQLHSEKSVQYQCINRVKLLKQELKSQTFLIQNYAEKTKMLESQVKVTDDLRNECKQLKEQIEAMDGINTLLTSSMGDAEKLLKNESDPKILSLWVTTLKRELRVCEVKKNDMRKVLKTVQSELRKEIDQKKKQEERISQLESENYALLEKIKVLEATVKSNNNSNEIEKVINASIGLNTAYNNSMDVMSPPIKDFKEEKRLTLSPTIKDNIKKIEESSSPYFNIKSCNVLMPHLLMKNHEARINNTIKTVGNKVTMLKISPTKSNNTGAIRKTKSDLTQKYSIFRKPRYDLVARSSLGSTVKPLQPNYAFNGLGGSERVNPFENKSDDECIIVPTNTKESNEEDKSQNEPSSSIHNRLKTGGLRNFKVTK